jgi:predicted porin
MKKTLVALAAVSAVSAFAQVTLTGNVDVGYKAVSVDMNPQAKLSAIGHNNSSTTAFFFQGTEDLGGGLKASFMAELDWAPTLSSSANQNSSTAALSQTYTGTPLNGEQFLAVSGGFGTLKLGTPNSPMLSVIGDSNPFGTALGGGFSSGFGRFGTGTASGYNQYVGAAGSVGRIVRHNKAAVFDTPEFMPGLKAQIEYVAGNSNGGWTANDNNIFGTSLRYANGPIKANYSTVKASAGNVASSGDGSFAAAGLPNKTFTPNALEANASTTWNAITGSYTMGATTIMAGMTNTKTDGMTTAKALEDSKSQNIAIKYVMGNVDLLGNYLRRSSGLTQAQATDQDTSITTNAAGNLYTGTYATTAKLLGLGANYNFSKNTLLYVRYESIKGINANKTTTTAAINGQIGVGNYSGASQATSAIGLRMVF